VRVLSTAPKSGHPSPSFQENLVPLPRKLEKVTMGRHVSPGTIYFILLLLFFTVLGFELRAPTLSHSTNSFFSR
jgi:hypothetical protein